jgi:hypothetical protein
VSGVAKRAYVASHFALELGDGSNNQVIGFVRSIDGGGIKAEMLTYQQGVSTELWRQIGKPKFDDITVQVGMGMSVRFWDWIKAFFKRDLVRQNGALLGADFGYVERTRRTFMSALIAEVGLPAVDGSAKDPCYMTVKIAPEQLAYEGGTQKKISCAPGLKAPQKKWLAANFRLQLEGYDTGLKRVMKVDALTIKQQILEYQYGPARLPTKVPGRMEIPNLTFYIPEVDAEPFVKAVKKRIVDGDVVSGGKTNGSLTYLASDNSTELCSVGLKGIDILSCEPEKYEASAENIHKVKVQVQVEAMEFDYKSGATA